VIIRSPIWRDTIGVFPFEFDGSSGRIFAIQFCLVFQGKNGVENLENRPEKTARNGV
jgi:hypothetical protein